MLQKNFPGRKNKRRINALKMLKKQLKEPITKEVNGKKIKLISKEEIMQYKNSIKKQIKILEKRIQDPDNCLNIKTKKMRGTRHK